MEQVSLLCNRHLSSLDYQLLITGPVKSVLGLGGNVLGLETKDISSWVQFNKVSAALAIPFEELDFISSKTRFWETLLGPSYDI